MTIFNMLKRSPEWIVALIILLILFLFFVAIYQFYYNVIVSEKIHLDKSKITPLDRIGSIIPYCLPLLEGLQNFGQQILPDYPFGIMYIYKKTLMPFVLFYVTHPALAFIAFFVLYYLFVRAKSPIPDRPFIRFNVLQSILLFLINSLLGATFRALPIEFRMSLYGLMLCNTLFWFVLSTIFYSIFKALEGKYARIPVISQAVRIQIDNQL